MAPQASPRGLLSLAPGASRPVTHHLHCSHQPVFRGWIETRGNLSSLDDKVSVTRAVIRGNESQKKPFDHLGGEGGGESGSHGRRRPDFVLENKSGRK